MPPQVETVLSYLVSVKFLILYVFILSAVYVHFRGKERLKFRRQLLDHSTFMAPYNCFIYATSAVPNTPYLKREDFPQLDKLQDNWEVIRDEALGLVDQGSIRKAEKDNDAAFHSFFRTGWKRFYLKWYGDFLPSAERQCPKTVELVNSIPGLNAAMFALLPPGAVLGRHRDPFAGSLRYHLGLVTPNSDQCAIWVDGQPYAWHDGEDVVFDETFVHTARNDTDQTRVILFCDVERPLKFKLATWINRGFKKVVVALTQTQNEETEKVGLLNKLFSGVYKIRNLGQRLKKWNRTVYKIVEWAIYLGLFYLIFLRFH